MINPIFSTALKHPELVVRHLANYIELVRREAAEAGKGLVVQAIGGVVALVALLLAIALTGVAAMLGVMQGTFHWVLVVVPAVVWGIALLGVWLAMRSRLQQDIKDVREEVELDMNILRVTKELKDE
ncbi:MAG: hypothetical protein EOP82_06600 [Variovorax sp.]|nr:MAG: hypothetical protein EOP82_06600 [Variovorax sp.]